jgi:hypothetical protein
LVIYDREAVYNFTPGEIVSWKYVQDNATIFQIHNQFELA